MEALGAARVVTPDGVLAPGEVLLDRGVVADVRPASGPVPERTLVPGFVDLQVNGHVDVDVAGAQRDDWNRLDDLLVSQGVTTWFPTLTSRPLDAYAEPLGRIADASARAGRRPAIAGAHLEGPFLAPSRRGAHPEEHVAPVDLEWLSSLPESVRIVTLAPEIPGGLDAVALLADRGLVVSLGHSDADAPTALAAAGAGATLVTHLFNASAPFHHRDPGLVGAALADGRLTVTLIADLVHLDPVTISAAFAAKGRDGVAIVTDAVAPGATRLAGVISEADGAARLADGTIAGSTVTMARALANLVQTCGVPLEDAVASAATTPARVAGLDDRGALVPGLRADVVALSPDFAVEAVWIAGEPVLGGSA